MRKDHEATHGLYNQSEMGIEKQPEDVEMFNYQHAVLILGLLIQNYYDAISEGDGDWLARCWKFFTLLTE